MDNLNFYETRAALVTSAPDQLILVKFWHAMSGLYIWEYFTTLNYEWGVIRGRLPYRWTIWIYSLARLFGLVGVILCFVSMDATTQINCQLWVLFSVTFLCLASIIATLLIVLRTIAIWNKNKAVVALTIIVWGTGIGFHIHNIALVRSAWYPTQHTCASGKDYYNAVGVIATITADMVLLLIVLAGLLFMRRRSGAQFGLTRLLWKQGIIWLVLGFTLDAPQLMFTSFNMNDQLHNLFASSNQIVIIIAATRMHRSLVNFTSTSGVVHNIPQASNLTSSKTTGRQPDTPSTALDRVEITIHTTEQHTTSSMDDDDSSSTISTFEQTPDNIGHPSKYSLDTKDTYAA